LCLRYKDGSLSFFFSSRRRHTRSKRDWSSDVCSSDLQFTIIQVDYSPLSAPALQAFCPWVWIRTPMNLLKSLAAVSSMTMFSRVLGFIRDTIIARIFGAGMATDAFFVAFKLPNLLRRIFAEGAFSQAFVPILAEYKSQQGEEAARTFVAYISGMLTLALAVVTLIGIVAAPVIIWFTAPGFTDTVDKYQLTSSLLRITFPYIFFISLAS